MPAEMQVYQCVCHKHLPSPENYYGWFSLISKAMQCNDRKRLSSLGWPLSWLLLKLPDHASPATVWVDLCFWKALEAFSVSHPHFRVEILHQRGHSCCCGCCQQVWPLTQFFSVSFLWKLIDLPGGQISDPSSNTILFRSSPQPPRLRLRSLLGLFELTMAPFKCP